MYSDKILAFEAAENLEEGKIVELTADGKVQLATADSKSVIGVVYVGGTTGSKVSVMINGVVELTAGGVITPGSFVKMAGNNKVVAWDDANDTANMVVGKALTAAANDGDDVEVLLG